VNLDKRTIFPRLALMVLALAALACGAVAPATPTRAPSAPPTRSGSILPATDSSPWSVATLPPAPQTAVGPTATSGGVAARATATRPAPTATPAVARPAAAATRTPTPDPGLVIITEADITQAVAAGATASSGLTVESLAVRFTEGRTRITAARLGYGMVQVQNLVLVGRLVAQDGVLQLQTESISPSGLVTALAPTIANQALAQYAGQWYVEEVRTLEGRIELRVR
jgi:hypothetical protein